MSGGVDSSVAAALLKRRGFNVVGVFFKPWSPRLTSLPAHKLSSFCNWQQDRQDAMRVAAILGIKFKTWDFSEDYGKKVVRYMIESYQRGITPNPDVMCNKEIKFGLFMKRAIAEGADYIATGHYVKSAKLKAKSVKQRSVFKLLKAKDKNKDQSYFLWTLTQGRLRHCLFPIGDYTKPQVRKLAKKFGLPTYNKKDSQGICFVGELDMKEFLKHYIRPKPGPIRLIGGNKIIGQHDGVYYYTIGQRHGLNIGIGGGPYYVADKDLRKDIIYVSTNQSKIKQQRLAVTKVNWTRSGIRLPIKTEVKIRYRNESIPARISRNGRDHSLVISFLKPAKSPAPGQSAVFYKGEEVLGGGVISKI